MCRIHRTNHGDPPANWAEWLNDLGQTIRRASRSGTGIEVRAGELGVLLSFSQLALAFVNASDLLKLQAMVEDWSCERIAHELCQPTYKVAA